MRSVKLLPPLLTGAVLFFIINAFSPPKPSGLKVLLNSSAPTSYFDPARAVHPPEYFFLENTFSTLLEYSADGELVSGIAETFRWMGTEASFSIRPGLKTPGGQTIDAYDAEQSLKRLFIIGGRDYSLLSGLLCGPTVLKTLSDHCTGLQVRDGGRTLKMKLSKKKTFLFHLLTNIQYAVIPRGSVDPTTLKIIDHRNTSGPYFVSSDNGDGVWELHANPFHYRYSPDMPQTIKSVPLRSMISNEQALAKLTEDSVDYMISSLAKNPDDKRRFVSENKGYSVNFTQPVRMIYVVFTDKGLKTLTKQERFFIARKLRELYLSGRKMCEAPNQLFKLDGALTRDQVAEVRKILDSRASMTINKKLSAAWLRMYLFRKEDSLQEWLPHLSEPDVLAQKKDATLKPDFFLNSGDIGLQDDIGLAFHYLSITFFDMNPVEKDKWLTDYLAADNRKTRASMLQDLHYRTLKEARVLPIALMPYSSVVRKPWKFNYPTMFGGDNLWRLRR